MLDHRTPLLSGYPDSQSGKQQTASEAFAVRIPSRRQSLSSQPTTMQCNMAIAGTPAIATLQTERERNHDDDDYIRFDDERSHQEGPACVESDKTGILFHLCKLCGMLLMFFSIVCLSVCLMLTKMIYESNPAVTAFDIFFLSAIVQIVFNEVFRVFIAKQDKEQLTGKRRNMILVGLRQACSVPGWIAFNYSARKLPIGFIQLFQNSTPMVSLILARLIIKEKSDNHDLVFNLIAFAGVTISSLTMIFKQDSTGETGFWEFFSCVFTVFAFACVNVISRLLKGVHYSVLGSAQQIVNVIISAPFWLFVKADFGLFNYCTAWSVMLILMLAVFRFLSTMSFIRACQMDTVSRVAFINYFQSPMGYLFDIVVFSYALSLLEWISVALVVLAGVLMFRKVLSQ